MSRHYLGFLDVVVLLQASLEQTKKQQEAADRARINEKNRQGEQEPKERDGTKAGKELPDRNASQTAGSYLNLERHAQFMWYTQLSNRLQSFIVGLHRFVNAKDQRDDPEQDIPEHEIPYVVRNPLGPHTRCFNGTCVGTAIILVLSVSYF